jgi:hypothetical protein
VVNSLLKCCFGALMLYVSISSCGSVKKSTIVTNFSGVWIGTPYCKPKKISIKQEKSFICNNLEFTITDVQQDGEPLTVTEEFQNAFKGNYYSKFFEKIHIDSKLYRVFRDSVLITSITAANVISKPLFQCTACNKFATLQFRNRTYHYPFYWPESSDKSQQYQITVDSVDGYQRKIWVALFDTLPSGVSFRNYSNKYISVVTPKTLFVENIQKTLSHIRPF